MVKSRVLEDLPAAYERFKKHFSGHPDFQEAQKQYKELADRAKSLLSKRLQ